MKLETPATVLSSGYVALDVIVDGDAMGHRAGGTAANVAANLTFLGWRSQLAALLGSDPAGGRLRGDLVHAGVGTDHVTAEPGAVTPVVVHEVLATSHRFRFGCPECGRRFPRHRPVSVDHAERVTGSVYPDVFFFDRVSASTLLMAQAVRERGGLVVFEPATRGREHQFSMALQLAHIVKLSADRLEVLQDRLAGHREARQIHVLTNGGSGAAWRLGDADWRRVPGFAANVVDAGGAGDWTTAALLAFMPTLQPEDVVTLNLDEVLRISQAVAAISCGARGARGISQVMTREELLKAAGTLLEDFAPPAPPTNQLRKSRRTASCGACLAAA